ncbi:crk-like protein [Clavelina lepadiformis]|uniref:Crk-like protein n=1 Tax=Clavelina lepadiformis TaxID=159417 RepID=A0ABP0F1M8_CLALP
MASANFNSHDKDSWYFGAVNRKESQEKLLRQKHGTFLVRDSTTCPGDYVLSVSENSKVSHYIINNMQQRLKIGDQMFDSMPELLDFYKVHYLDTTTLIEPSTKLPKPGSSHPANSHQSYPPALGSVNGPPSSYGKDVADVSPPKREAMPVLVRALFDFKSDDSDDLPFSKGEILEIVEKPEENWWNARNSHGRIGQIPVPYVEVHVPNRNSTPGTYLSPGLSQIQSRPMSMPSANDPVYAEVITRRVPNAYDPTALALEVGDIIKVTKMNKNGQWEGTCNSKTGWFPFTHVKVIDTKKS